MPLYRHAFQRIAVSLQAYCAEIGRGGSPQLRLVAHIGHLGDDAPGIAGNDKVATLVAHATGKKRGVGGREQHHVGILGGLPLVVDHAAFVPQHCLLRALHVDDAVAHHRHRDGIEADEMADGLGNGCALD